MNANVVSYVACFCAIYCLACSWCLAKPRRFTRGGWSVFPNVVFPQWNFGLSVFRVTMPCIVVHLGPLAIYADYDAFAAKRAAQAKADAKAVDELIAATSARRAQEEA